MPLKKQPPSGVKSGLTKLVTMREHLGQSVELEFRVPEWMVNGQGKNSFDTEGPSKGYPD